MEDLELYKEAIKEYDKLPEKIDLTESIDWESLGAVKVEENKDFLCVDFQRIRAYFALKTRIKNRFIDVYDNEGNSIHSRKIEVIRLEREGVIMNKKAINLESEELKRLMSCFPKSFINMDNELILVPRTNLFLSLNTIYSDEDLKYRVISACSRSCVHEKSLSKYWARITRNAVNMYLEVDFGEGDYRLLYSEFGNRCNEEEARLFIEEGMDITQFDEWNEGPYKNITLADCIGHMGKTKERLKDIGGLLDGRYKENKDTRPWYEGYEKNKLGVEK